MSIKKSKTSFYGYMARYFKYLSSRIKEESIAFKGAGIGLLFVSLFFILISSYATFVEQPRMLHFFIGSMEFIVISFLVGISSILIISLVKKIPIFYGGTLATIIFVLYMSFFAGAEVSLIGIFIFIFGVITVASLIGASIGMLICNKWQKIKKIQKIFIILGLLLGITGLILESVWFINPGETIEQPLNAAEISKANIKLLDMPDPSQIGAYKVKTLIYGAGNDRQRQEYNNVDLITGTVDGSQFTNGWSSKRINDWGFGPDKLPINGRVWYPDGEGSFPLVLIVHGNHVMYEFSDPGYDYLGELLASRGFIVASIDENFLNSGILPEEDPEDENDARGWLLLEHLHFWNMWNNQSESPFYKKIDMNNIALIGHSRGGEAVAIAAEFNKLPSYPDNVAVAFNYNYNIRSVIAIAPSFGRYKPQGKDVSLENVNYFVLQGSNDQQILSFVGLNQYSKVRFTDDKYWFKTALYIGGANHAQFNTVWIYDQTMPTTWLYNQKALISFEDQKQIARTYISAFLETTLKNKKGYLPFFQDYRVGFKWLPNTIYLNQFQDSTDQFVSTYEEDANITTTTMQGGLQSGENLTIWREDKVNSIYGTFDNYAVYLGWNNNSRNIANYNINLPDKKLKLNADDELIFSLADANENPISGDKLDETTSKSRKPIDITVEVIDDSGNVAKLPLSSFSYLQPQIIKNMMKGEFKYLEGTSLSEPIFQSFKFSLSSFMKVNPLFNPTRLKTIRFIFDRTNEGVVILDEVGFRKV